MDLSFCESPSCWEDYIRPYACTYIKTRLKSSWSKSPTISPSAWPSESYLSQFWGEKAIYCMGNLRDYILTICSLFTDFRTCAVIVIALWFNGPLGALAWVANKRNGFTHPWLLWNNVDSHVEMQIINAGAGPLWLPADVSANFKHRWDSKRILLAQVPGYNKGSQIIW